MRIPGFGGHQTNCYQEQKLCLSTRGEIIFCGISILEPPLCAVDGWGTATDNGKATGRPDFFLSDVCLPPSPVPPSLAVACIPSSCAGSLVVPPAPDPMAFVPGPPSRKGEERRG